MSGAERRVRDVLRVVAVLLMPAMSSDVNAQGARWSIAATPTVRLGASEAPDEALAAPAGATRLPNGNIIVGDLGEWALREFSPQGNVVKRFGRKGKGPGEVTYLAPLLRCGDTLVAYDIAGPVSVYSLDGKFVRAFRFKTMPYRLACNAKMQFAVMGWERDSDMKSTVYRPTVSYMLARADTSTPRLLASLPGGERIGPRPYPLGLDPRVAMGPSHAYIALSDSLEVHVFNVNGERRPSFLARASRVAATQDDLEAEKEREIAMMGEKARRVVTESYAKMPQAKFLPGSRDLLVDAEGNVWLQHFPRARSTMTQWTVFAADGKQRANIELPSVFDVYEIGRDYILGRYIDPDESIPEVRLYSLKRSR